MILQFQIKLLKPHHSQDHLYLKKIKYNKAKLSTWPNFSSILSSQFGRQLLVSLTLGFSLLIKLIYIASESNLQIVMS